MSEFSISQALGAGFRLIGRHPLAVVVWGFLQILITVVPMLLVMALLMPAMFTAPESAAASAAVISGMTLLQPISLITSILAAAIVFSAVYRAVLTPQDDRSFYVRFGQAELWQGLLQLVYLVGSIVILVILGIIFALIFGAAFVSMMAAGQGNAGQWPAIGLGGFIVGLLLLLAFWWLALRFSLAGPMTFADKQFRLFESWTLTKGQTLKLFGLSLLIVLMLFLLYLASILVLGLLFAVLGVGVGLAAGMDSGGLERMFTGGGAGLAVAIPLILVGVLVSCAIYGMFLAVVLAPWAEVYRQLSGRTVDAETFA